LFSVLFLCFSVISDPQAGVWSWSPRNFRWLEPEPEIWVPVLQP